MAAGLDFARAQLEKSGWKEGSGLGRQGSGITEAIKVKLKMDNKGVGHNGGDEFTFRWWDHSFNKAAGNIKVDKTEEGISVKMAEESGPLSSKRPDTQKMLDSKSLLYGRFVKSSTVMKDGIEEKRPTKEDDTSDSSEDEDLDKSSKRTDEEMFKLCGGRTAHKGARHGLGASGKLSRVEKSERDLLERMRKTLHEQREKEAKRERYGNTSSAVIRGNLKRRKNCHESDSGSSDSESEDESAKVDLKLNKSGLKSSSSDVELSTSGFCDSGLAVIKSGKKSRECGAENGCGSDEVIESVDEAEDKKRKKSKRRKHLESDNVADAENGVDCETVVVTKKKKRKEKTENENEKFEMNEVVVEVESKKKSKKSKRKDKSDNGEQGSVNLTNTGEGCNGLETGKKKSKKSKRKSRSDLEEVVAIADQDETTQKQKKKKSKKKTKGDEVENVDLGDGGCVKKSKRKRNGGDAGDGVESDVDDVKIKKKKVKKSTVEVEINVDCNVRKSKKKKSKK